MCKEVDVAANKRACGGGGERRNKASEVPVVLPAGWGPKAAP